MKFAIILLPLLVFVSITYARSLTPNDVLDPPKRSAVRLPPIAALPHVRTQLSVKDNMKNKVPELVNGKASARTSHPSAIKTPHRPMSVVREAHASAVKVSAVKASYQPASKSSHQSAVRPPRPVAIKASNKPSNVQHQPVIKAPLHVVAQGRVAVPPQTPVKTKLDPAPRRHLPAPMKVPQHPQTNGKNRVPSHAVPNNDLRFGRPVVNEGNATTAVPPPDPITTSTTLDPWEEFCKEACEAGMAGPECDCAGHPIGRREAPLLYPISYEVDTHNLQ